MPTKDMSPTLTVQQVLEQIDLELATPRAQLSPTRRRLVHVRRLVNRACAPQFEGRFTGLKRLLHRLNRTQISRQHEVNEALLRLVEDLFDEMERTKTAAALVELEVGIGGNVNTSIGIDAAGGMGPLLTGPSVVQSAPTEMLLPERFLLYSLTYGLKPQLALEIGTFRGGSSLILCAAMDDAGQGRLICVDPAPRLADETWEAISHRASLYQGDSPAILSTVTELSQQAVDLVLVDGNHTREAVLADGRGIMPFLAPEAYILFHDCHYAEVKEAIETLLTESPQLLQDCGILSVHQKPHEEEVSQDLSQPPVWGGLRLLRFHRGPE